MFKKAQLTVGILFKIRIALNYAESDLKFSATIMNVMDKHIVRFLQVYNGSNRSYSIEGEIGFLEVFTGQPCKF